MSFRKLNLEALLQEVRDANFRGRLLGKRVYRATENIEISWSQTEPPSTPNFGLARYSDGHITVHPVHRVSWFRLGYTKFTLYHELLHAVLGFEHTALFNAIEAQYPGAVQLEAWYSRNWQRVFKAAQNPTLYQLGEVA